MAVHKEPRHQGSDAPQSTAGATAGEKAQTQRSTNRYDARSIDDVRLIKSYRETGDANPLIRRFDRLLRAIARRHKRYCACNYRIEEDDLYQHAAIGALSAFRRYDETKGSTVTSYVGLCATTYCRKYLDQWAYPIRWGGGDAIRRIRFHIGKMESFLQSKGVSEESMAEEIARLGNFKVSDVEQVRRHRSFTGSSFEYMEERDNVFWAYNLFVDATPENIALERNTATCVRRVLEESCAEYSPKYHKALVGRLIEEKTLQEVGAELGVTRQRVEQMIKKVYPLVEEKILRLVA